MKRRDEDGEDGRGWRRAERRHRIKSWFATPFNRREGHSSQLGGKGSDSDAWDHDDVAVAIHHASEEFQLKADALQPHQTARASAASKAQDIKNVSTPRISNVPDDGPIGVPRDCWSIARERFIRDDANLWNLFEAVLFKTTVMDVNRDFGSSRPPEEMMRVSRPGYVSASRANSPWHHAGGYQVAACQNQFAAVEVADSAPQQTGRSS